jgi:NADPH2:quinone reductase
MRSEAIGISRFGDPGVMESIEVDVPDPGPGEVRIRNRAIGVNFIDIYHRSGHYAAPLPHVLGFEGAGEVEAVGPGVADFREGDRVAYPTGPLGAYSAFRTMPVATVVQLPSGIAFEKAAAMMLKGLTVQYLFRQSYRLQGGETIVFHAAAGGVGLIACQWARVLGVQLIGTAGSQAKAARALGRGAWRVVDTSREPFPARVLEWTQGAKVPVVYDGVGRDTWEGSLDCLQPRGLLVSFGSASGPVTGVDVGILARKGSLYLTRPTLGHHIVPRARLEESARELFDHVLAGRIDVDVGRTYRLADAAQAHADLEQRRTSGSCVLIPG